MRILITGSRDHHDYNLVSQAIHNVVENSNSDEIIIVEGGARGADRLARNYGEKMGYTIETHNADWKQYGKRAGFLRNQKMVNLGADICLAFPLENSRGTHDCVKRARQFGIPVEIHKSNKQYD